MKNDSSEIHGHGIDLVRISRIREIFERQGEHFEKRLFSEVERRYCRSKKDPFPHFAVRFAAKEAYGKALGLGLGPSGDFIEIEVDHDEKGAPFLQLHGSAKEIFLKAGYKSALLSLTHEGDMAMASVILKGD